MINGKDKHVISYLQDFLFSPDRARVKVSLLSGGEKNRLLLAKLFSRPANVIVMDEPTNDLDIETLELLEEKLSEFEGTLLIISHDRAFLDNVVTQLWVIQAQGKIQEHVGGNFNWDYIIPKHQETMAVDAKTKPVAPAIKKEKLSYDERRELNGLPKKITTLENDIALLQQIMLQPDFYQQSQDKIKTHTQKLGALEGKLAGYYDRWQVLEEKSAASDV